MSDAPSPRFALLPNRGALAIVGDDRATFLQGLVSNDVRLVAPDRAVYAWLMTPQGKYLHDFIIFDDGDALLLDVEAERRDDLLRRLKMYKLRSKITLEDRTDALAVAAVWGGGANAPQSSVSAPDPRAEKLGLRVILPKAEASAALSASGAAEVDFAAYDGLRLSLGVPDGVRDLIPEKSIAMENNMDALGALSWTKGCYMGQELTARTKYRGLVKKRLVPVVVDGDLPAAGTPVTRDGREVGELRSGRVGEGSSLALALLRIEELEANGGDLQAGGSPLRVAKT